MANKQTAKIHRIADEGEDVARGMAQETGKQAERLQQGQERLLSIYASFMTHWMQRRQEAAQAALEVTQRALAANGQPGRLPEIYTEWMNGSMERMAADIRECQSCGSEIVSVMQESVPLGGDFRPSAMSERVRD